MNVDVERNVAHLVESRDGDSIWSKAKVCVRDPSLPSPDQVKP